jgi:hypothetical protein
MMAKLMCLSVIVCNLYSDYVAYDSQYVSELPLTVLTNSSNTTTSIIHYNPMMFYIFMFFIIHSFI